MTETEIVNSLIIPPILHPVEDDKDWSGSEGLPCTCQAKLPWLTPSLAWWVTRYEGLYGMLSYQEAKNLTQNTTTQFFFPLWLLWFLFFFFLKQRSVPSSDSHAKEEATAAKSTSGHRMCCPSLGNPQAFWRTPPLHSMKRTGSDPQKAGWVIYNSRPNWNRGAGVPGLGNGLPAFIKNKPKHKVRELGWGLQLGSHATLQITPSTNAIIGHGRGKTVPVNLPPLKATGKGKMSPSKSSWGELMGPLPRYRSNSLLPSSEASHRTLASQPV